MSGPTIQPNTRVTLGLRDRILALAKAAGQTGITSAEVAQTLGHKRKTVTVLMGNYVASNHLWNRREGLYMRYFHKATVPVGEGAAPLTKEQRRALRLRQAAMRVNMYCEQPSTGPVMPRVVPQLQLHTEMVDGVRVTTCEPLRDMRYTVDPEGFTGGAFVAEWQRLRAGPARARSSGGDQ